MAYIKKLKSGNFQAQIRLKGLRPITKTFSTKTKATAFARQVEGDSEFARKLGAPVIKVLSFEELIDLYMQTASFRDPSAYGRINYWRETFKGKPVNSIDEFMVDEELHKIAEKNTGSTVNRYKSHLSAIFTFLIRHKDFKRLGLINPVMRESVTRYKENPAKDRFLSKNEQKRLLEACKQSNWDKMYLLILLALTSGARKGEILGLRWKEIDFKERVAFLGETKNGKPRYIPLTQKVVEALMRIRDKPDYLIFHSTVSEYSAFDVKKQWANVLKMAGIEQCRFHDLRHSAASNYIRAGRSLFEVGTLLGHSSTQMTARYSHLAIHDTLSMADAVAGSIG